MQVYEIEYKVATKMDIKQRDCSYEISRLINNALATHEVTLDMHNENHYKEYSFDQMYPVAKDGVYIKEQLYTVRVRTVNKRLAEFFYDTFPSIETNVLKGVFTKIKILKDGIIEKVYSITPVILKNDCGYWRNKLTFDEFEKRLKSNLIKKYNYIMKTKINEDFPLYYSVSLDNNKPVPLHYKNVVLLGDKITIHVSEHPMAQEIFKMALGMGILENNTSGAGFLNYKMI